jgi:AcrR family transcriptional regulator
MALKDTYHHGALRTALLDAALEILEAEGLEKLSLRKVAAKVGVSHAAPAHHFPTLRHLLTELAIIGFQRFDDSMRSARSLADPEPVAQMRAAQVGYLAFSGKTPALFRLMFTATLLDWSDPNLPNAARPSRSQLSEVCAPAAQRHGLTNDAERLSLENMVWSQIHGRAHLMIENKFEDPACDRALGGDGRFLDLAELLFR